MVAPIRRLRMVAAVKAEGEMVATEAGECVAEEGGKTWKELCRAKQIRLRLGRGGKGIRGSCEDQ